MSPVNNYANIEKAMTLDIDEEFSVDFLEGLSPSFRDSLDLHRQIWPCFEGRQRFGRLSTPDPACVRHYSKNIEMGQTLGLIGGGPMFLTDEDMTAFGIIVLKSLHSLITLMHSVNKQQEYLLATNGSSIAGSFYQTDSDTGVEHQLFQSAGCFMLDPSGTKGIMSTLIPDCLKIEGAGSPIISIPSSYTVRVDDPIVSNIQFAVEGRLFRGQRTGVATGSGFESLFQTCTDTAVLSTRVASYDSGLYHCCITKNYIDMLGEGFGSASFTLTLGLFMTTPLFFPFQKKHFLDGKEHPAKSFQGSIIRIDACIDANLTVLLIVHDDTAIHGVSKVEPHSPDIDIIPDSDESFRIESGGPYTLPSSVRSSRRQLSGIETIRADQRAL